MVIRSTKRKQKITVLIVVEGKPEYALVHHLRCSSDSANRAIQVKNGQGGSPLDLLNLAHRIASAASFDHVAVMHDHDVMNELSTAAFAKYKNLSKKIDVIVSIPTVEALFLTLFNPALNWSREQPKNLKKKLRGYIDTHHLCDYRKYRNHNELSIGKLITICDDHAIVHQENRDHIRNLQHLLEIICGK